ncbi:hypothetical protein HDU91_001442 [Kappamyces sp. JEL0680]|nr:hypothetical protein HDU91_001442 [Kappamyces sp. JEL0680]
MVSQLDLPGYLLLVNKAFQHWIQNDRMVVAVFLDVAACVDILTTLITVGSETTCQAVYQFKIVSIYTTLLKTLYDMEPERQTFKPQQMKAEAFELKWESLGTGVANGLKALLKKDAVAHLDVVKSVFEVAVKPLSVLETTPRRMRIIAIKVLEAFFKTKRFAAEHLEPMRKNGMFKQLLGTWDASIDMSTSELGTQFLGLVVCVLNASRSKNPWFLEYFDDQDGHDRISRLLCMPGSQDDRARLLELLLQLATHGPNLLENVMEVDRDSPFQHSGFMMPVLQEEFQFRNLNNLKMYQHYFQGTLPDGTAMGEETETLRYLVVEQLLQLIQLNPVNYFIITSNSGAIYKMIEDVDTVPSSLQQLALAILKHVVVVLGYVPFKELSLLFDHFRGCSKSETVELVAKTLLMFLESSLDWRTTLQELGLINTLSSLILFIDKEMAGAATPLTWEGGKFVISPSIKDNFGWIMSILEELLKNDNNLKVYRGRADRILFSLLKYPDYAKGAASVIKSIITKADQTERDLEQFELGQLVQTIEATTDPVVMITLIALLKDVLRGSGDTQNKFRKLRGFEALSKALHLPIPQDQAVAFLKNWFTALFYSIADNDSNRAYIAENGKKLDLEGAFALQANGATFNLIIRGLFGISYHCRDIYQDYVDGDAELRFDATLPLVDTSLFSEIFSLLYNTRDNEGLVADRLTTVQKTLEIMGSSLKNRNLVSTSDILVPVIQMLAASKTTVVFESNQDTGDKITKSLVQLAKKITINGMSNNELRLSLTLILGNKPETQHCKGFLQDLILHTLRLGRTPDYFLFEPKVAASSGRIALDDFGRSVPPQTGYTLIGWFRLQRSDAEFDIPLLTIVDNTGQERLAIFVAKGTRHVHVRTLKGTTKLPDFVFPERIWTHIALVHHKPMLLGSTIDLLVNGNFVSTEKCSYWGHPGSISSIKTFIGSFADPASREAGYELHVGPTYFIGEYLMDVQTASIIYDIGFEYSGNWQGSWAAYMVGNKNLQKKSTKMIEEEGQSPIFNQLATFAMSPTKNHYTHHMEIPEETFWFSISARNCFSNLPRHTKRVLVDSIYGADIKSANHNVVLNGGHSKNGSKCSVGRIEGELIAICPRRIIEGVWTIGGCALLLRLVEDSATSEDLHKNLSILVGCVNNSWRNLAEMERGQMYEILSFLLKSKKSLITIASLDVILALVGKSLDSSNDSMISNPSALRHLVLDIELWRNTIDIQRYYLNQITDLIVHSSLRAENIHTLNKMAMIKRFVMMLENQIIDQSIIPDMLQHMKILLREAWSGDIIKLICTSIINTLPKGDDYREIQGESEKNGIPKITTGGKWKESYGQQTYALCLRNRMLEIIIEIIEEKEDNIAYGEDLLHAVTARWILLFMNPRLDSGTVFLGTKLLHVVWSSIDYPGSRFHESFSIVHHLLQSRFYISTLYLPLLSILCDSRLTANAWKTPYDVPSLMAVLKPKSARQGKKQAFCSDVLPCIISMLASCVRTIQTQARQGASSDDGPDGFSAIVVTTLEFFGAMYLQIDQMKDALLTQDAMDDLFSILFALLSTEPASSIDHGMDLLKKEPAERSIFGVLDALDEKTIKLFLKYQELVLDEERVTSRFLVSEGSSIKTSVSTLQLSQIQGESVVFTSQVRDIIDSLMELFMIVSVESILEPGKPLHGLELIIGAIPPCSARIKQEFEEFLLMSTMNCLFKKLSSRKGYFTDPRASINIMKFVALLIDGVERGLFRSQKFLILDFAIMIATFSADVDEEVVRTTTKPTYEFGQHLKQLGRICLLCWGNAAKDQYADVDTIVILVQKLVKYQSIFVTSSSTDNDFLKSLLHHLFQCVLVPNERLNQAALTLWKVLLLQKPNLVFGVLKSTKGEYQSLVDGFSKILDDGSGFMAWLETRKSDVTTVYQDTVGKTWEDFKIAEAKALKDLDQSTRKHQMHRLKRKKKRMDAEHHAYIKFNDKTKQWVAETQSVGTAQKQKFKADYKLMQTSLEAEWISLVTQLGQEHAILAVEQQESRWKLDFTEARARMRKKLRRNENKLIHYQSKAEKILETLQSPPAGESLKIPAPVDPASDALCLKVSDQIQEAEPTELVMSPDQDLHESSDDESSDGEGREESRPAHSQLSKPGLKIDAHVDSHDFLAKDDQDWEEVNLEENQNMKIQRLLQQGDSIIEIVNCARLVGLELIEGIVLICQQNIYLVDNYFRREDGEVLDYADVDVASRNIYHLIVTEPNWKPNDVRKVVDNSSERHACRQCAYVDIKEVHKRLYLFRNVALELFMADGRNFFLSFWTNKSRDNVYNRLLSKSQLSTTESVAGITNQTGVLQAALFGGSPLAELTQKWQNREISNLAYLMHLNTLAGRSYNDLTQYPTFPWILSNYTDTELDLEDPSNYRDLSLPMGGQGPARAEQFADRFNTWDDPTLPGCHYGTHYSSSMIVCSFLLRLEPFTEQYLKLQGGHFDHPDRLFHSIPQSWNSASKLNTTDVRELIPEFFYLPNFLLNQNKFDFGSKQTGEVIDDVVLPAWALDNSRMFIKIHRLALESEHVSANIHNWIDLVFGYKQQGEEAAKALNVFHYLSYEGAVDIDQIQDPVEKQSTISIIHNFGQTPKQIFKKPHPKRNSPPQEPVYRVDKHFQQLIQSAVFLRDTGTGISDIQVSATGQLCIVGPKKIFLPGNTFKYLEWGHFDQSIRIFQTDNQRRQAVFESLHIGQITSAVFADQDTLITGGEDMTVCLWEFTNGKRATIDLLACMRGHRDKITCLSASRSYSIVVSGSEDCTCIIWDLNRHTYSKSLVGHEFAISQVTVNQNTGDIITCDGYSCNVWDINGELICTHTVGLGDWVTSCIPFDGKASEVFDTDLVFTGHNSGVVRIWKKTFRQGDSQSGKLPWCLKLVKVLAPAQKDYAITFLSVPPSTRYILSGDARGRVIGWMLPDSGTDLHFAVGDSCLNCQTKLAVIGRKANCRCCGGLYCLSCVTGVATSTRCGSCSIKLSESLSATAASPQEAWTMV